MDGVVTARAIHRAGRWLVRTPQGDLVHLTVGDVRIIASAAAALADAGVPGEQAAHDHWTAVLDVMEAGDE